ncbi:MAG TPA: FAD-binding and (Fe-S)-binding domain-containing protein [Xanthobacteraceae bacterium]|nr:FAD-binding and (Fe-S)-binding domain-containing protein [Xanthobacteraceae bacterium]
MDGAVGASPAWLRGDLETFIAPDRVLTRPAELIAFASDASFYRLVPKAVVLARGIGEIQKLFRFSHRHRIALAFRTAGTSLSGQAVTDGILVEVARNWKRIQVEDGGRKVRVEPGVIGAHVNLALHRHRAKIGPDPASINACMMGGILANNSSGMCCGVAQNAYHTLDSLTFVLPSGTVIDTAAPEADEAFRQREPTLAAGLVELKQEIESRPALRERIRAKYRSKNTTGYSLNAFIDFDRPVDIMRHLLIGSEGTLAFIAEAVLNTVPDLPVKYTGLLLFEDLHAACAAIGPLSEAGAAALELMDRASLRSVEDQAGVPAQVKGLPPAAAALLAEFQCADSNDRAQLEATAHAAVTRLNLLEPALFTHAPAEQAALWKIRAGMFPSVGAVRKSGTTVIIEDVAFPVDRLADAAVDLTKLFARHGYDNAIIFGHAKDGNLHFVITQSFNDQAAVDQYARFIDELVKLVVDRYDGALKAEHGTGRNMAPFVEAEWGAEALAVMRRLKALCDPQGLLNPGVIVNSDPRAHLAALKPLPSVEEEVDKCIECGYCESKCPSRELTTTPRQRIVLRREIARLRASASDGALLADLEASFPYSVLDTCAADGLCATACPVAIDTSVLVKRFRRLGHGDKAQRRARRAAEHFGWLETALRLGLAAGHGVQAVAGAGTMRALTRLIGAPPWSGDIPFPAGRRPRTRRAGAEAIYFPSCIARNMGRLAGEPKGLSPLEAAVDVARRAGVPVHIPDDVAGVCCGVPFSSKGFDQGHAVAANRAIERMWGWSQEGRLPVFVDTSPCTYGLRNARPALSPANQARFDRLRILDIVEFMHDRVLPRLTPNRKAGRVALHPVCAVIKMNLSAKLEAVARACAADAVIPVNAGCCGFAGDRGFLVPELTAAATRREAAEINATPCEGYFSSSRTCEVGLTRSTGHVYRSFVHLMEEATR